MTAESEKNLLQVLTDDHLLTAEQIKTVQNESLKRDLPLERLLEELQLIKPEELVRAKGKMYGVSYADLSGQKINHEVLTLVSEEVARSQQFVFFSQNQQEVSVAMLEPFNMQALETVDFITRGHKLTYRIFITDKKSLDSALKQYRSIGEEVGAALKGVGREAEETSEQFVNLGDGDLSRLVADAPISQAVAILLRYAVRESASDLHMEPLEDEVRVRFRIDGKLRTTTVLSKKILSALIARIKILANLKLDEHRVPQDGRFQSKIADRTIDFRVSILPTVNGEKAVIRILDSASGIQSLEELGLSGARLQVVKDNIHKSHGMFLVTGPTGSGKSTTLYSVLDIINEPKINIVTLEDPVEYYLEGVSQSQVQPEQGFSFATGLRSILRQDPDVMMIGEIRDSETAELAVHAALTGHLVFSTLHTNNSYGAIPRLIDMKIEKFLLISSLNVVVGQRLVRKLCNSCRQKVTAAPDERLMLEREFQNVPIAERQALGLENPDFAHIYHAPGCPKCGGEGYSGRVGIFECLPVTPKIQDAIINYRSPGELVKVARTEGFITMLEDGVGKVLSGITTVAELLRATQG